MQRDGVSVGSYAGRRTIGTRESAEITVERPILLNQKNDVLDTRDVFRRCWSSATAARGEKKGSEEQWAQVNNYPESFGSADGDGLP